MTKQSKQKAAPRAATIEITLGSIHPRPVVTLGATYCWAPGSRKTDNLLILLVGAQGLEPWTR